MDTTSIKDPFVPLCSEAPDQEAPPLPQRDVGSPSLGLLAGGVAVVGRLHGFDLEDRPIIGDVPHAPGQLLTGRSTIALRRAMRGREVVVLFDGGDVQRPIIIGLLEPSALDEVSAPPPPGITIEADQERYVVTAEREIVLRCGDASITLTRAGKVLIQGNYVLSRSTGCNKIKGAAVDIN